MYHCQVHFYLVGRSCKTFEIIKGSVPLDNFTHTFSESSQVEEKLASQADVIMMHLADMDIEESVRKSVSAKRDSAELILLAEGAEAAFLAGEFPEEGYSAFFSGVAGGQEREEACESGPECLLAAVKDRGLPFLERVRAHPKCRSFFITPENRDRLFLEVLAQLRLPLHKD